MERKLQGTGGRSWLLPTLAGIPWLCAVLIGLEQTLMPTSWAQHNATLMWVIFGVLVVSGFCAVVLSKRRADAQQQAPAAQKTIHDESVHTVVNLSWQIEQVVIASPDAIVHMKESGATSVPVEREGRIEHQAVDLTTLGMIFANAENPFVLINMWWHRVGLRSDKLPPYSEACLRCGGTTKLLYSGAVCPNCEGTGLRLGVDSADYNRLIGDGEVHSLAEGPIAADASLRIANRTARLGVPNGWEQRTSAEIAKIQALEGNEARVIAQLYPLAATPEVVYAVTVSSATVPAGFLTSDNLFRLVLIVEQSMGLRAVSRVDRVAFGGDVGWLWHLEGTMPGHLLSRPHQSSITVHCAELWAPVDARTVLKILLTAPPDNTQEATDALNTMISSWRWDQ